MTAKYNTYVLELIRNNEMSQNNTSNKCYKKAVQNEALKEKGIVEDKFLMLDYFDVMRYRELQKSEKKYMYYFSVMDPFGENEQCKMSHKTLSLYQYAEKGEAPNPFKIDAGNCLSEKPFLGIIQVCLCEEVFKDNEMLRSGDVDGFLRNMEGEILNIVGVVLKEERGKEPNKAVWKIYRSSTTGDFCLALRTDSITDIYDVATRLNDTQNDTEGLLKALTYTNIGIECREKRDGSDYCTFKEQFLKKHEKDVIALRFATDSNLLGTIQKYGENIKLTKGLFGRYDFLLHISIREFAEIYPELCRRKFGDLSDSTKKSESLGELISHPWVRHINERILVDCDALNRTPQLTSDGSTESKLPKKRKKMLEENDKLLWKIQEIENYRKTFAEENRAFQDLYRGMKELYKAFSSIAWEQDAVINWRIWCRDMDILCDCIFEGMKIYKSLSDEEERRTLRYNLLGNWREGIQAIYRYTRLVQNVNYQTYQAPVYEMQTQIDAEKVMVAYREAMRTYVRSFLDNEWDDDNERGQIEPIIYPELREDKVRVKGLFANLWGGRVLRERAIVCMVPSFEYFGRLYDLMPWILHEASHYFRVLDREERNQFVIDYIISHVFKVVAGEIIAEFSKANEYVEMGLPERTLLASLKKVAREEIGERIARYKAEQGGAPSFEQMVDMMSQYLMELFPCENGVRRSFDTVRDAMFQALWEELRQRRLLDDGDEERRRSLLQKLEAVKSGGKNIELVEELVELLLCFDRDRAVKMFPKKSGMQWINMDDFALPFRRLEERVLHVCEEAEKEQPDKVVFLEEYAFAVRRRYRVYWSYKTSQESRESGKRMREFLENVYDAYDRQRQDSEKSKKYLHDPEEWYFLNNVGLLSGNKELFCNQLAKVFEKISGSQMQERKIFRTRTYREAFADLLMTMSLGFTGFGYCRQIMQTVSDTKVGEYGYSYDNINYNRFRIVAAVLMAKEGYEVQDYGEEECRIDGRDLIEKGKLYCLNTLRCIQNLLWEDMQRTDIEEDEKGFVQLEKSEQWEEFERRRQNKRYKEFETLKNFLGDIYVQLEVFLDDLSLEGYKQTLLYVFLHGIHDDLKKAVEQKWNEYREAVEKYVENKHQFWRLECFCRGLSNILADGYIVVERAFFDHMREIYGEIVAEDGRGCKWEAGMWKCMKAVKESVGDFYNTPETIYEETPENKLENTIDFIQSFYYHNRVCKCEGGGQPNG